MEFPAFELYSRGRLVRGTELCDQTPYALKFKTPLRSDQQTYIRQNYKSIIRKDAHGYTLQLGNHVGQVLLLGQRYHVTSKKWNEAQVHKMFSDISRRMAALPYQFFSVARQLAERTPLEADEMRYHQWVYLRDQLLYGRELQNAWEAIQRNPYTAVASESVAKESWNASRPDEKMWQQVAERGSFYRLHEQHALNGTVVARRLAERSGHSLFPDKMIEHARRITYDTRENRFLKHLFGECFEVLEWMEDQLGRTQERSIFGLDHLLSDNRKMKQVLLRIRSAFWLDEVGEHRGAHENSTVLHRRQGYRQWFAFYQEFLQGIRYPLEHHDLAQLVESKDIARLFEYWCLFEVLDAIETVTGVPCHQASYVKKGLFGVHLKNHAHFRFLWKDESIDVFYNKTFSRSQKNSYTLQIRPDISVSWRGKWHHFDAKFKDAIKRKKLYLTEDLSKMHLYRDAIHDTESAIALYPVRLAAQPSYFDSRFSENRCGGVGALGLNVEEKNDHLVVFIRRILSTNNRP